MRLVIQYSLNSRPGKLLPLTRSFSLRSRIRVANGIACAGDYGGLFGRFRMGIQVRQYPTASLLHNLFLLDHFTRRCFAALLLHTVV
jgi:hypothetical protein